MEYQIGSNAIYFSDIIPNVIAIPAEAEPEIAERMFVVTAPFIKGFVNNLEIPSLAIEKPGSDEMTAPKPYSVAEFMMANKHQQLLQSYRL